MVSLSLCNFTLKIKENNFNILFLLSKLEKCIKNFSSQSLSKENTFLFLFSKLGKWNSDFSFSSQNWRNCFQIAPFLLDLTLLSFVNQVRVAHSRVVLHSFILKYLKWATNFNADREKALSHYHAYNCHIVTLPWHTF